MKNIHVLPTEKPSRLCYVICTEKATLTLFEDAMDKASRFFPQNIYITSDEEIKDCWVLNSHINEVYFLKGYYGIQPLAKKIILTTDSKLIADGVQAIDDDFLEWFIKNPSCEEVKIELLWDNSQVVHTPNMDYKIIIPKEEVKQETLEEAAKRYSTDMSGTYYEDLYNAFINGAKWKQEQILNFLYSEITERRDYSASKMCEKVIEFIEQFKNK